MENIPNEASNPRPDRSSGDHHIEGYHNARDISGSKLSVQTPRGDQAYEVAWNLTGSRESIKRNGDGLSSSERNKSRRSLSPVRGKDESEGGDSSHRRATQACLRVR